MVAALFAGDSALALFLPFAWLLAGAVVVRLPSKAPTRLMHDARDSAPSSAPGRAPVRGWAALALVLIGVAVVLTALRVAVVAGLAGYGWWFVQEKVVLALPLLVLPALAVLLLSVPRIGRLTRRREPRPDRVEAAHPAIGVPVRAATFGAVAGWAIWAFVGYGVTPASAVTWAMAVAAATALAWWRQSVRWRRLADPAAPVRPRFGIRLLRVAGVTAGMTALLVGGAVAAAASTRLPDRIGMDHHDMDYGGGPAFGDGHSGHSGHGGAVSVADLRGGDAEGPVKRFTLTADEKPRGRGPDAWAYNGQLPGPELRVRHGDVVEVSLENKLADQGATIHWHGYDVPNGEDGVAGITQDAVRPGKRFTYRFRADQVGTYWYHSHELSSEAVQRGLYGTLVVEPKQGTKGLDLTLPYHQFHDGARMLGDREGRQVRTVERGTPVRLRLVNTDNDTQAFALYGTPYRLAAIDGTDVNRPGELAGGELLKLAGGGRYDLTFTMPDSPVLLGPPGGSDPGHDREPSLLLSPDGGTALPTDMTHRGDVDITAYGEPAETPFGPDSDFDREFTQVLDAKLGFADGGMNYLYTVNGKAYPNIPTLGVRYGDLVKVTVVNRGLENHPMHPHGHHVLVLSRNGRPVTGSPLWMDTFNVAGGEVWEVAMKADNPGIWMDHCHNLWHAANGMVFHLAYEGVTSPYQTGRGTINHPE